MNDGLDHENSYNSCSERTRVGFFKFLKNYLYAITIGLHVQTV